MKLWTLAATAAVLVTSTSTNAALIERLGGLAYYDDVADLTWLADANAAGTNMNWADAKNWATNLNVDGIGSWRLPYTLEVDNSCDFRSGYGCTGSEMGNLFYNVLGGVGGGAITTIHTDNYDLFSNVQSTRYWSATENTVDEVKAWYFNMNDGFPSYTDKVFYNYAWAVHDGDVSAVPVPAAVWLFGSGLIGLVGFARRKKA